MVHDEKQFHATAYSSDSNFNRSGSISNNIAKLANNTYWKLGLTALAAGMVCLLDHNRTVNASELNHSVASNSFSAIDASRSTQVQQRIYRVQPGDTINRIAKKLQVSKADLTALNKINNSNIIFVNQQLKIPAAVTKSPLDATSISPSTKLASSKLTSKTNIPASPPKQNSVSPTAPTEDPYIIKLKQEIDLLREQSIDPQSTNSVDLSTASRSLEKSASEVDLNSVSQNNLNSELLKNQTIALRLPPLPPSEEYLPSAFDGYIWPAQGVLTSGYGWRWGRLHRGIDIAAPIGTPILAAASGVVVGAGWHSGYGNLVKLEHLDGSVTLYGHTNKILVSHGQKVEQGQQIAEMGNTGYSTGSHLHFEIHPESEEAIDPLVLLGSR